MATDLFDHPLYVQRKYFVQEIAGLDDVFDYLDEWPMDKRKLSYDTLVDLCQKAANRQSSVSVVRENLRRFLLQHDKLASVQDLAPRDRRPPNQNIDGV